MGVREIFKEDSLLEAITKMAEEIEILEVEIGVEVKSELESESLDKLVEYLNESISEEEIELSINYGMQIDVSSYWKHLGTYKTVTSSYESFYDVETEDNNFFVDDEIVSFKERLEVQIDVKSRRMFCGDMHSATEDYTMFSNMSVDQRERHAIDRKFTYNFVLNMLNYDIAF